jgi:hypothetical protein
MDSKKHEKNRMKKTAGCSTTYPDIQRILNEAVENENIGMHGAFWRTLNRDGFVAHVVFGCPLIFKDPQSGMFVGKDSNLVNILRGPINCGGNEQFQMPVAFPPVPEDKVQTIEDWIDAQCPA